MLISHTLLFKPCLHQWWHIQHVVFIRLWLSPFRHVGHRDGFSRVSWQTKETKLYFHSQLRFLQLVLARFISSLLIFRNVLFFLVQWRRRMATAGYYQLEVVYPCDSYPTTIYIICVIGPSLVLCLSLQGFGRDGEYLQWLAADLANANQTRKQRPWLFVAGHRPLYTGELERNAYMRMVVF